jgi:glycosyltransferase involved in cell wall biosynthesis/SAM-dependent methyltransferase
MAAAVADSDHFIAVSPPVAENLVRNHGIAPADISCLHPYIKTSHFVPPARVEELRAELGLQPGDKVVFGCGTMDWRKGPDLFVQVANEVIRRAPDARFIWIGADTGDEAASRAKALATDPRIRFLGERETPRDYLALGGAFLLSSREDPFPLVTLEAADAGLPAVCFAGAGGMPDFVGNSCGRTVPFEDVEAAAKALTEILTNDPLRETLGRTARASVRAKHDAAKGSDAVLAILKRVADGEPPVPPLPARPLVSVIVPNYNYASFLPDRLESILKQTHRVFEILVLDDASTDSSLAVIESYRRRFPDLIRVLPNTTNSGSPYPQWLRGIREAKGDLVWIAEADDSCEPDFLEALLPFFEDSSVGIAYCQSLGLDEQGCVTRTDFLEHTEQLNAERWKADYTELGLREALDWMSCRNTIINASAALIRREALAGLGDELLSYRSCGDWFLYLSILRDWNIGYSARSLNKFRRHSRAVTRTTNQSVGYLRELTEIRLFLSRFFPLHHSQISRLNHFLDRDYALEGIASPSLYPATLHVLEESERNTVGRLRLAFISTNYSAPSGGSEILWQRAALEARRRGHDVVTLTKAWRPCPPFTVEFAKAGIKHFETENGGHESIVSFQPDLAIISTGNQDEGIREFELFSANNIPYVIVHQLIKELPVSPSLGTAHDDLVRKGAHAAKRVFFVSKNNHQIMERRLACPIPNGELVFNPLDIPPGEPIPMPDFSTGIHIAFPANILFIHKGHDILLKVMAMEKWRQRPITINLYGKGEDEGKVREILAREGISNVHLCGHIAPAEIWKKNHAVLLASRMEGQSLAMIGAMVAGRVPIVTAVGGSAEVIRDNETGFLAAHPTPEHLDEALERAWQRRNEWTQIGIAARQSVLNLVPPDPVGDFVDRLQSLLESKYSTPEEVSIKIPQGLVKHSHGFCPICEKNVTFSAKNEWLRDHYLCSGCGSIPRERAIMHVIQQRYPNWRELRIHESSPGSRGASVKLREQCKHYIASQYDPELGFGNTHSSHGYRSEDLEKQAFPDESFDIVVTQDVMEHIFDAESAFRDIHRTLKPGGAHIFTTPLINKNKPTQQWAKRLPDGTIVHLHPPEYHGNPMSNEGSLVTWHWGFDIVDHIQNAHGGLAEIAFPEDSSMGIEAQYLEVIVQKNERKSTNLILSPQYHQILDKILLHINRCEYDIAVNELNSVSFVSKSEKNHIRSIINEDVLFKNKLEWNNHGITKTFRFFSQEEKKHYLLEASALIEVLRKKSDFICLGFGVVLGFVRAQDFIPHDDDIDILIGFPPINLSSAKAELVDFLEKNGYRNYCDKFTHMTVARGNPRIKRCLDIFIGIIEEGFFSCFPSRRKGLRIDNVFPAVDRNFFDCPLPFPRNTEGYLESVYGPDWRNPISNWNHPWDRKEYSEFL